MPELIDRHALKNHLYRAQAEAFKRSEWYVAGAIQSFIDLLDKQPTVEPEVRHGWWIYGGYDEYPTCSYCKQSDTYAGDYCGNCGARMDATDTNVGGKGGADNG